MTRTTYILYSLLIALLFSACRKDVFTDDPDNPTPDPKITITTDVMGQIVDVSGIPLQGAEIRIADKLATSNEQGSFLLRLQDINDQGTLISIRKNGYFNQTRIIYPNKPRETCFVHATLIAKEAPSKFQSNSEAIIEMNGNAKVEFKANSISYEGGGNYNGEVLIYAYWYDPTSTELASIAPASLEGINSTGDQVIMESYGMVAVELTTPDGTPLQITDGETATLQFPLPSELEAEAPAEIPLWYLDEENGKWVQESSAKKENGIYIGQVSHFSFWNADYASTFIKIEGYLTDDSGVPLANYPISIKRMNAYGAYGQTNSLGFYKGLVPNDEVLTMFIFHCGVAIVNTEIGPFSEDTDLGTLALTLTDFATSLQANLRGCVGESLPFAYGLLNGGQFLVPDEFGNINTVVAGCGTFQPKVTFYDGVNLNQSDEFELDKNIASNDLGNVTLCNNIGFYVRWTEDGANPNVISDPKAFIVNDNKIVFRARQLNTSLRVDFDLLGTTTGLYNPIDASVSSPNAVGPNGESYLFCSGDPSQEFSCDDFEVELLSLDLTNNIITGSFAGSLIARDSATNGSEVLVEGIFRTEITDIFDEASISGKVWIDLNNNGIRDIEEEDATMKKLFLHLINEDPSSVSFGNNYYSAVNGDFLFEGIRPGNYRIRTFTNLYELTAYQSGDPDKDNDFEVEPSTNSMNTEILTLVSGENLENIDIGFKSPTEIVLGFFGGGCIPDLQLNYNINGGLLPYQIEMSNGYSISTEESYGTIDVTSGGLYELTVTDALGNSTNRSYNLLDYSNFVNGFIWEEDPLSDNANLFDFNLDKKLKDVTVLLKQADGTVFDSDITTINGYTFRDIPDGDYYIEVPDLSGYSLVDQTNDNYLGSQINPATYKSDIFTVISCNSYTNIAAGYKLD